VINKIDFAAKNLTSKAGLFLLLENAKNNRIFELNILQNCENQAKVSKFHKNIISLEWNCKKNLFGLDFW